MREGRILAADHNGAYALKLVGDVRVNLCSAIDDYLEHMFNDPGFESVMVDLCEAEGIDSTTLGLLAKPMTVTLPFVLLLLDWWPLNRARDRRSNLATSPTWIRVRGSFSGWPLNSPRGP